MIKSSPGGWVEDYLTVFSRVRQSGEKVIIDGPCLSACTLARARSRWQSDCVTKRAVLGFHAADQLHFKSAEVRGRRRVPCIVIDFYPAGRAGSRWGGLSQAARPRLASHAPAAAGNGEAWTFPFTGVWQGPRRL